jgi:hypothetical protein
LKRSQHGIHAGYLPDTIFRKFFYNTVAVPVKLYYRLIVFPNYYQENVDPHLGDRLKQYRRRAGVNGEKGEPDLEETASPIP